MEVFVQDPCPTCVLFYSRVLFRTATKTGKDELLMRRSL
jgi:hypothetical protein